MKRAVRFTLRMHFAQSHVETMTPEELRAMIGEEKIAQIKARGDQNPFFKAWIAMHGGLAFPEIDGPREKKRVYFGVPAIQTGILAIKAAISKGLNFILGHNGTEKDAPVSGEVVAVKQTTVRMRDPRMGGEMVTHPAIAVAGYFPPASVPAAEKAKAVSVEAVIDFFEEKRQYVANMVKSVTDIALLTEDDPGFAGAVQLATLRAKREGENGMAVTEEVTLTASEIRRMIRAERWRPEDLFDPEEIVGRRREVDGRIIYEGGIEPVQKIISSYEGAIQERTSKLTAQIEQIKADSQGMAKKVVKYESAGILSELAKERKLPDAAMVIVNRKFESFDPDLKGDVRAQLGSILDIAQKEHEENVKLYGAPTPAGAGQVPTRGEPASGPLDMTKPEHNPLIPR